MSRPEKKQRWVASILPSGNADADKACVLWESILKSQSPEVLEMIQEMIRSTWRDYHSNNYLAILRSKGVDFGQQR